MSRPLRNQIWHASGGIAYHWRAWRHHKRWQPFISQVARWLTAWAPPQRELLLVGPSAAYTLPLDWLARFARIDALEPDPLARRLFRWRAPALNLHFDTLDCLSTPDGMAALNQRYPRHAILFANVLGQIFEGTPPPGWVQNFKHHLAGRCWASYHDIIATALPPARTQAVDRSCSRLEDILPAFWDEKEIALYDHGCLNLFGPEQSFAVWPLTRTQHHLIGWYQTALS